MAGQYNISGPSLIRALQETAHPAGDDNQHSACRRNHFLTVGLSGQFGTVRGLPYGAAVNLFRIAVLWPALHSDRTAALNSDADGFPKK